MGLAVADLFATLGLKPDESSWKHGDKLIEGVKKGLEAFAGYEAIKKINEMVDKTVEAAVGAERLGQKVGISAEAVQELGYAASVSGASTDDLQVSMQHLARGLEELRTKGTGPAQDALQALRISYSQLKGEGLDQNLEVIADRFKEMPDGPKKTAAAMDLFGRSGTALIPLLNKGKDGIVDLRNEAEKLGVVISEDGIKKAEEYEEAQKRLAATFTGLRNEVVIALLPALKDLVETMVEWVKNNREAIETGLRAAVHLLMFAFQGLAKVLDVVAVVLEFMGNHAELARTILTALGIVIGAIATEAAIAWLVSLGPILLVVGAITALIFIFKDWLRGLLEGKGVTASVLNWIADKFKSMARAVLDVFKAIGHFFASIASAIRDAFVAVIDWVTDKIEWIWNQLKKIGHAIRHPGEAIGAAIDYVSGSVGDSSSPGPVTSPAAVDASRYVNGAGGRSVTTIDARSTTTINANGTDPQGVADIAKKQIDQHHDRVWRDADAGTGGKDDTQP